MWRDWIWAGPAGVLVLFWIIYALANSSVNPFSIIYGEDGRPSTSKLQFFVWTVVALYAYVAVWIARLAVKEGAPTVDIPQNLVLAMGLSASTAIAAKAITVQSLSTNPGAKTNAAQVSGAGTAHGWAAILQDDTGVVDLTKVQIMAWTVIAVAVYLMRLVHQVNAAVAIGPAPAGCPPHCPPGWPPAGWPPSLPDLDTALLVLTGVAQGTYEGTYVGKKLVTSPMPQLCTVQPSVGPAGTPITLIGAGFGPSQAQGGSLLTINGRPYFAALAIGAWTATAISTTIPETGLDGSDWPGGATLYLGVIVGGQESNRLAFTIQPHLRAVQPTAGPAGTVITLTGGGFHPEPGAVIINGATYAVANPTADWSETAITLVIPDKKPDGSPWSWPVGHVLSIKVRAGGQESNAQTFTIRP